MLKTETFETEAFLVLYKNNNMTVTKNPSIFRLCRIQNLFGNCKSVNYFHIYDHKN